MKCDFTLNTVLLTFKIQIRITVNQRKKIRERKKKA